MSAICDAHKKKVDVELWYNSVNRKFNQLETRYGRESQHPAERAIRPPIEQFRDQWDGEITLQRKQHPAESWASGWATLENEKDTLLCPEELGRSICCSSVRSPTPSHTQPFQIKWEVYFSKELCRSSLLCRCVLHACICVCIVGHGYTTIANFEAAVHRDSPRKLSLIISTGLS